MNSISFFGTFQWIDQTYSVFGWGLTQNELGFHFRYQKCKGTSIMVLGRIRVDLKFTEEILKHNKTTCYILF